MKRYFVLLVCSFVLCGTVRADQAVQIETFATPQASGAHIKAGCSSVTFIFNSSFVGTIQGAAFTGSTDSSVFIPANGSGPGINRLSDVYFTITAGSLRVVEVR